MNRLLPLLLCCSIACSPDEKDDDNGDNGGTTSGTTDDGDTGDTGDTGTTDDPPPPDPWVEYYYVESVIDVDNGSFIFEETYWASRSIHPENHLITERFVAEADGTETGVVLTVNAELDGFSLDINGGEYTGAGNLYGDAWDWSSWDSISNATDGTSVHSTDTRTATGITSAKVGFGTEGLPEWEMDEVLTEVTEADFEAGLAAID